MNILVLNGVNLNLLGIREPHLYGEQSLSDIENQLQRHAAQSGAQLCSFQTNSEALMIEKIHAARGIYDGIIINAGAWTHSSIAIRDALLGVQISFIEVHLSNIYAREAFRHHSYLSDKALGVISGLGSLGYFAALDFLLKRR